MWPLDTDLTLNGCKFSSVLMFGVVVFFLVYLKGIIEFYFLSNFDVGFFQYCQTVSQCHS